MNGKIQPWLEELLLKYNAKSSHLFILHGNIYDLTISMADNYLNLFNYLGQIFEQRDLQMFYSISSGLQFADKKMEKLFRERYLDKNLPNCQSDSVDNAANGFQSVMAQNAPLSQLIGDNPEEVLRFLDNILVEVEDKEEVPLKVLIIDSAHNIAPNDVSGKQRHDRICTEVLDRWSRSELIRETGNIIILLTPNLSSLSECLRSGDSQASAIRIARPDEEQRSNRWSHNFSTNGIKVGDNLAARDFGRITSGFSFNQIDSVYNEVKLSSSVLDLMAIKEKKQQILETSFGDQLRILNPKWNFDYVSGLDHFKRNAYEMHENIRKGILRRVPMGIMASGPPGTCKTFFFECFACVCNYNCAEIVNPRNMYVGKSEERMQKILDAAYDMAPIFIIEDEADQSEPSRDAPNGDSGVTNHLRQMKFQFCSNPKIRGKVIWVRISNRDDLIDAAYKRKGRTDEKWPFILPGSEEFANLFQVMFKRYKIPSIIKDFSPFIEAVKKKVYCTGADVEWMVLEADKYAGREGKNEVESEHLMRAVDDWELDLDPRDIDQQTILAIKGSTKRLRPPNWKEALESAKQRMLKSQIGNIDNTIHHSFKTEEMSKIRN